MPYFERIWRGNDLITAWDRPGSSPRSFQADFGIDPTFAQLFPTGNFTSGPMKRGRGRSCGQNFTVRNGQNFTVRNGQFDFTKKTVKFDMIFDEDHPPEEFSGTLNGSGSNVTSVKGTIKVKPSWLRGKPPAVYGPYSRYRASVTLY